MSGVFSFRERWGFFPPDVFSDLHRESLAGAVMLILLENNPYRKTALNFCRPEFSLMRTLGLT